MRDLNFPLITLLFLCLPALHAQDKSKHYTIPQMDSVLQTLYALGPSGMPKVIDWCEFMVSKTKDMDKSKWTQQSREFMSYNNTRSILVNLYIQSRQIAKGIPICEDLIAVNKRIEGADGMFFKNAYEQLILVHQYLQNDGKLEELYQQKLTRIDNNLQHYFETKNTPLWQRSYQEKGQALDQLIALYNKTGNSRALLETYLQKKQFFEKAQYTQTGHYDLLLSRIGLIYTESGEFAKAKAFYKQARTQIKQRQAWNSPERVALLGNEAILFKKLRLPEQELFNYKVALPICLKIYGKKSKEIAAIYTNMARVQTELLHYPQADSLFDIALDLYTQIEGKKSPNYITTLSLKAFSYNQNLQYKLHMGELVYGDEIYNESIKKTHLYILEMRAQQFGRNHPEYANALIPLATYYQLQEKYEEAALLEQQALDIREKTYGKYHTTYINLLHEHCKTLEKSEQIEAAIESYQTSNRLNLQLLQNNLQAIPENNRQNLLINFRVKFYEFYAFVARHIDNYPELAIDIVNIDIVLKGIDLEGTLDIKKRILASQDAVLIQTYKEWIALRKQISYAFTLSTAQQQKEKINLKQLKWKVYDLENQMMEQSAVLKASLKTGQQQDYQQLKKHLAKDEICIAFIAFPIDHQINYDETWQYYALLISPNEAVPSMIPIANRAQLNEILDVPVGPSSINYISDEVENENLYYLAWEPLESYIDGYKKLYLSPTGVLTKVAFGALTGHNSHRHRLINEYDIRYLGTLRELPNVKSNLSTVSDSSSIDLIGGALFTPQLDSNQQDSSRAIEETFSYLKGTKVEIQAIGKQFKSAQWAVHISEGLAANEQQVKALSGAHAPTILHIATHGFFFEKDTEAIDSSNNNLEKSIRQNQHPLIRSGLALAGANESWNQQSSKQTEDGLLTAYEVSNLDFNRTNLVVLSACETGLGQITETEGVLGLQSGFKLAGVPQVLISLWKVPDRQTSELMQLFYQYYLTGNTFPKAFQKAQQQLAKKYPNPYYWAAFVLIE